MTSSAIGLGLGATIGGAIPAIGAGVRSAVRGGADILRRGRVGSEIGKELGVSNPTGRILSDIIGQDDPIAMQDALRRAGPNAMLADVSPQATGMLDMAMRSPIPAARTAAQAVDNRAGQALGDVNRAMDQAMAPPQGLDEAMSGIRKSTADARKTAYDSAFAAEIDWRSPAGEKLRGLLQTTPDDVMRLAARNRAMKARAPDVPDSAYASEFAPTVTQQPGPMAGDYAGRQEVESFFNEYDRLSGGARFKRPIAYTIKKMGGIDPQSPAAAELRARGITPRTAPGLFRNGGMKDVDNLSLSDFPDTMAGDGTGNYASRQGIIDAIESEARGDALRNSAEYADEAALSEMDRLFPDYVKRQAVLKAEDKAMSKGPTAPVAPGDKVPMKSVYDIDQIKRALDEVERTNDGKGLMGGQTEYGVEAGRRAREIRDTLKEISPDYSTALETATDTIGRVKGVEFGSKLLRSNTTREQVRDFVKTATGGEIKAVRVGLRSQIDETLANVRAVASDQNIDARAAAKAFSDISSPATRQKMALVLGDEWPALQTQLDQAGAALGLRARTSANSATFGRGASDQAITEEVTPSALRSGKPIQAVRDAIASAMGASPEAVRRARDDVKGEIAALLTRQGGNAPQNAVDTIMRALAKNPVNQNAGNSVRKAIEAMLLGNAGNITGSMQERLMPQIRGAQGR